MASTVRAQVGLGWAQAWFGVRTRSIRTPSPANQTAASSRAEVALRALSSGTWATQGEPGGIVAAYLADIADRHATEAIGISEAAVAGPGETAVACPGEAA